MLVLAAIFAYFFIQLIAVCIYNKGQLAVLESKYWKEYLSADIIKLQYIRDYDICIFCRAIG